MLAPGVRSIFCIEILNSFISFFAVNVNETFNFIADNFNVEIQT